MKTYMKTLRHACTWRWVLAVCLLCVVAPAARAAGSCTVNSTGLAFGAYQPLSFPGKLASTDVVSTATVSVTCSAIVTGGGYTISLGAGSYGVGNRISTRFLNNNLNGGAPIAFNAYTEASYSTVWGNGSVGALLVGAIPVGASSQSHIVYGKIPAGQNTIKPGSFSDSLTMTISYSP
jgi:spore coat protein U-like protein